MRLLRDSTLLAWLLIVAGLAVVLVTAHGLGSDRRVPAFDAGTRPAVVAARSSAAATQVEDLRGIAPAGIAAGSDPAALAAFGQQVAATATAGHDARLGEGAGEADPLAATLTALAAHGTDLAQAADDPVHAASLRTRILLEIDRATALIRGLPVPATLPAAAEDLYGDGTTLQVPQPHTPTTPAAPGPRTPATPPALDLTKPDPKDLS